MEFPRASGVLLHITSLPGDFAVGDLGPEAYRFVDFLVDAGQTIWQILPLGPTIRCDSPYSCYSAFAGNALLISPVELVRDGLLQATELEMFRLPRVRAETVDYLAATDFKWQLLKVAYERFFSQPVCSQLDRFEAFCTTQRRWLDDFALYAALMKHFGQDQWDLWDADLVRREPDALRRWGKALSKQIEFEQFVQFLFFTQWQRLKQYANSNNIRLFGDMPIFVAHGSADVWSHQELFWLDEGGKPQFVAGVPPDYFSKTGQLWGNPLYRWEALAATNYAWWTHRFEVAFEMYDLLRIDHFRAFDAYWEVPAGAATAIHGRWAPGPGAAPFEAARQKLGELPIVAEDLGLITESVHELRDELGFPGMRILQFGFDNAEDNFHRPEAFPVNSVAYTGTHDNDTIVSWYRQRQLEKQATGKVDILDRYLDEDEAPEVREKMIHWQLIAMVLGSASSTAIVPMQDILGLDQWARMNTPGLAEGNWGWRLEASQLNDAIAAELRVVTEHTQRLTVGAPA
ncbi:MAG: 4-alpha-glucanotransferase [Pirellulaceae bacterium]